MDQQIPPAHQQNNRRIQPVLGPNQNQHPPPQPCPRCHSSNTKFCYYNNYSLSQPRYFCKGCRRYWTHGGTLRNVPVGGGCRKSKRPKIASNSSATSSVSQSQPPLINNTTNTTNTNNNTNNTNTLLPYYGGASTGGFLSSLAAIQGVTQPLGFGPNLGLLHGLGLPAFDHQQQHHQQPPPSVAQQHNQVPPSFQQLLQQRHDNIFPGTEIGLVPTPATGANDWNLNNLNNNNDDDKHNNSVNNSQNQWPDFRGSSGLDDQ